MGSKEHERPRVLLVDDELSVVESLRPHLRRDFAVHMATSGDEGLRVIGELGRVHVVISDMRMPNMDGITFLSRVRDVDPDTVRLLLTGHADLEVALDAINRGNIFRFLRKPCPPDILRAAVDAAVDQYRLATQDKALLAQKLEETSDQLIRAERLATLGTMAGAVGHEINNMVTVLVGALAYIEDRAQAGLVPDAEVLADLRLVQNHLTTHASNLRNIARPGPAEETRVDARELVDRTVSMLRSAGVARHTRIELNLPARAAPICVHRTRIEQVLINLVKNAVDALDPHDAGARVRVSLSVDDNRGFVSIRVEDTGCGIAEADLERIFDVYFTKKRNGDGTGLGLSIVRQIVEGYGGQVDVESKLGEGSAFSFTLPVASGV